MRARWPGFSDEEALVEDSEDPGAADFFGLLFRNQDNTRAEGSLLHVHGPPDHPPFNLDTYLRRLKLLDRSRVVAYHCMWRNW